MNYCADLGCAHLRDVLLSARSELPLASRLAGTSAPIDGVTTQINDPDMAKDDAVYARNLGRTGKLCIHSNQIEAVQSAFAPTEAEIDWATRILASGDGAVTVDWAMVDESVRIRARAILASAPAKAG